MCVCVCWGGVGVGGNKESVAGRMDLRLHRFFFYLDDSVIKVYVYYSLLVQKCVTGCFATL